MSLSRKLGEGGAQIRSPMATVLPPNAYSSPNPRMLLFSTLEQSPLSALMNRQDNEKKENAVSCDETEDAGHKNDPGIGI